MPELIEQPTLELNAQLFLETAVINGGVAVAQLEPLLVTENPILPVDSYVSRHAAETVTLRERFAQSRLGRKISASVAAVTVALAGVALETSPAAADSGQEYTVTDAASGGVFSRNSPHMDDTSRIVGKGIYPGDIARLICGISNGETVNGNTTWHKMVNETRPDQGEFWESGSFVGVPDKPGELAPGERDCNDNQQPQSDAEKLQNAETIRTFINYDRGAAKDWALAHATKKPPDAGSCTVFISNALKAGGFPEDDIWNFGFVGINRDGFRFGSDATCITPDFYTYVNTLPYVDIIPVPRFDTGTNDLPQAKPGDIIIYDWDGPGKNGAPDHADLVVGHAGDNPNYPLASGWSERGDEAVDYQSRGWTWSEKNKKYLQREDGNGNMRAWLIHIRTEDDL